MSQPDLHNGVRNFLQNINMIQHWDIFKAKGYDREDDIPDITAGDLESMGIVGEDVRIILHAASSYRISSEFGLQCWLESHGLGHYLENFRLNDYSVTKDLERLDLDEKTYSELEMDVPGHRKRLQRAVRQLHKRRRLSDSPGREPEDPVARGYWGKPLPLADAKNDFLCLRAVIHSTREPYKEAQLEFMVDSGSDIMTLKEDVIKDLDLELIGSIQSRGVHSSIQQKQLYKALLKVGCVQLETEVMAESYESVGNQVIRSFRHYIDPDRHFWLQPRSEETQAQSLGGATSTAGEREAGPS